MKIRKSVTAKLVFTTSGGVLFIMILTAFFIVRTVSQMSEEQVSKDIENLINLHASGIENYFEQHATRIETIFRNYILIHWLNNHRVRGENLDTPEFEQIKTIFQRELDINKDIVSVFIGSVHTGEYVYEKGVFSLKTGPYNVLERPWWQEVQANKKWTTAAVTYEPTNQSYYIALNFPAYNFEGEFLGAGGADIYVDAIEKIVDEIRYKKAGRAFLIGSNGDVVFFPNENMTIVDVEKRATQNIKLDKLDDKEGNKGFAALMQTMQKDSQGHDIIAWNHSNYYVQYKSVEVDKINLKWKLAIMVPQELIEEPVKQTIQTSVLIILVIVLTSVSLLLLTTSTLLKPLLYVKQAMIEIVGGAGDLSQRLKVSSKDEISELAGNFNRFVSHIQKIVKQVQSTSEELLETTCEVAEVSRVTVKRTEQTQLEMAATNEIVSYLTEMANVVSEKVMAARDSAQMANEYSIKGQNVLEGSMLELQVLDKNFDETAHTIADLRTSSESIGEVIDVIKSIADQTNLLALNATIESARAGEMGRGFSVVADEVRRLSQRTQESTGSITDIIGTLQAKAHAAEDRMQTTQGQVNEHMDDSRVVHEQLSNITITVSDNRNNMQMIVDITQEQHEVIRSISEVMAFVNQLSTETSDGAKYLVGICDDLKRDSHQLMDLVRRFKV